MGPTIGASWALAADPNQIQSSQADSGRIVGRPGIRHRPQPSTHHHAKAVLGAPLKPTLNEVNLDLSITGFNTRDERLGDQELELLLLLHQSLEDEGATFFDQPPFFSSEDVERLAFCLRASRKI